MLNKIMVLNDGETWTDLRGCYILILTDEQLEDLDFEDVKPKDSDYVEKIKLS